MHDDRCTSGFLLVKTFARMCREYLDRMKNMRPQFVNLNKWGLFDTPRASEEYLEAYLRALEPGVDEGECNYFTVEVKAVE